MHSASSLLKLALPFGFLLLSSCAAMFPPNYRAYSDSVGYSEAMVAKDAWEIEYVGPAQFTELQAKQMALLRAAELTHASGRRWFHIVSQETTARKVRKTSREVTKTPVQDSGATRTDGPQLVQEVVTREDAWIPTANVVFRIDTEETPESLDADQVWAQGRASGLLPKRKS